MRFQMAIPSIFQLARRNMVDSQIRTNKVTDGRVISAFLDVPRERFLPPELQPVAEWLSTRLGMRWRPGPESNRRARICSPLDSHSPTGPSVYRGTIGAA